MYGGGNIYLANHLDILMYQGGLHFGVELIIINAGLYIIIQMD